MEFIYGKEIFSSQGHKSLSEGCFALVMAVIIIFTLFFASVLAPEKLGPWWIWFVGFAALLYWGIRVKQKHKTTIKLFQIRDHEMTVCVNGLESDIAITFRVSEMNYWYALEVADGTRRKSGEPVYRIICLCTINGIDGSQIAFRQMTGYKGEEYPGWPFVDRLLTEGEGVYHIERIRDFVDTIQNAKSDL